MVDVARGAWAASLTVLNHDLSIDLQTTLAHLDWLLTQGSAGVVVLGTTGEANSFSVAERLQVIAALSKSGIARERAIVGTGCCAAPDTVALTRAALDAGFPNVLMLPPFYYKDVSDEGIFRAFARVVEEIDDPRLKIFVYDIPQQTGLALSLELLTRLRGTFEATVVGIKNSSGDWSAMASASRDLPGFKVFAGSEEFLLSSLRIGGPGCISATANVVSAKLAQLVAQWQSPEAETLQAAATRTRLLLQSYPMIPALKEIMAHSTGREQWRHMRPPLVALGKAEAAGLIEQAKDAGILTHG